MQNTNTETESRLIESLNKVIAVAMTDTSGGRCCGKLLLAWEDTKRHGGWDVSDLWVLDDEIKGHVLNVLALIGRANGRYPSEVSPNRFAAIVRIWGRSK